MIKYEIGTEFEHKTDYDSSEEYRYFKVVGYTKSGLMKVVQYRKVWFRCDVHPYEKWDDEPCNETYLLRVSKFNPDYWENRSERILISPRDVINDTID